MPRGQHGTESEDRTDSAGAAV
eukprot:COSAG04_NODE_25565_length_306_cov_0.458937_1_plen_21_part_10